MPKSAVIVKDTEDERRAKFEQAVTAQHTMAVRTAEALRKVVLVSTPNEVMTKLEDFAKGQVDPQLQLVLIARDNFLEAEDSVGKLGFYKAMRDVFQHVDAKTMEVLDMAMKERHHREKMAMMEKKGNMNEPSDEEVDAALDGKDAP
jgi:hypothetical protein